MAAAISTTATTLEAQAFEIAQEMQLKELAVPVETRPNNVSIDPDFEGLTMTISMTIPFTFTVGSAGKMEVVAGTYLS